MTFSEPVAPLVLNLIRPDGSAVALDQYELRSRSLVITAPEDLAEGTHVLSWRVISQDGHPVRGSVVFSVGAPSAAPPLAAETIDWPVRIAVLASKVALYLGLFLGVGGAFAVAWLTGDVRSGGAAALAFLTTGMAGAVLSVGAQGLDALGAPIAQVFDLTVWRAGLGTAFGWTIITALAAMMLALLALAARGVLARISSLFSIFGTGLALALSGHASSAEPQWLTRPSVALHIMAIAFWIGALIPLASALRCGTQNAFEALGRFSHAIPFLVAALIVAGISLAVVQVQKPAALLETAYGRVFLVKLGLLAVLFSLAAINRWRLTGPVMLQEKAATRSIVRSITAETTIVILILAVAAAWRFTPPPRALAIAAAEPAYVHIHAAKAMADLTVTPGRAGPVNVTVVVAGGDFGRLEAKEVTLVLSNPSAGIEPVRRPAKRTGPGTWQVDDLVIPAPGAWPVRVDVLISDFEIEKLSGELTIRP